MVCKPILERAASNPLHPRKTLRGYLKKWSELEQLKTPGVPKELKRKKETNPAVVETDLVKVRK